MKTNVGSSPESVTEFKHTPGPWKLVQLGKVYDIVTADATNHRVSSPVKVIATDINIRDDGSGLCLWNGKLIAAAPELLEALHQAKFILSKEGVADIFRLSTTGGIDQRFLRAVQLINEAIKKATE